MLACGPVFDLDFLLVVFWPMLVPAGVLLGTGLALWLPKAIGRHQEVRRLAAGRCARCGYDLRASRDRCPECGTIRPGRAWNVSAWA